MRGESVAGSPAQLVNNMFHVERNLLIIMTLELEMLLDLKTRIAGALPEVDARAKAARSIDEYDAPAQLRDALRRCGECLTVYIAREKGGKPA